MKIERNDILRQLASRSLDECFESGNVSLWSNEFFRNLLLSIMLNVISVHEMLGVSGDKIEENVSEKKFQREKIISRALLMIKNTTIKTVLSGEWRG